MKKTISTLLFVFFSIAIVFGQAKKQPKIGFAFSGGGAKGLAHIGILKVMEEHGIYPDVITGTSMGSIVGGFYAMGYTPEQLEELSTELEWDQYFNDNLDRSYLTIEEKSQADRYQIQFAIKDGKVQLPTGVVNGEKIGLLLSRLTVPAHGITNFDHFKIPFRAVATDLATGEAVVLGNGFLADAIRASMSIPTVFQPVTLDGKLLCDGMLIRNLPVEEAFAMGADIVLAFDVGAGLLDQKEITSLITVMMQTSSYLNEKEKVDQYELANIIIKPEVNDYSNLDFTVADTLIKLGEHAARESLPQLNRILRDYERQPPRVLPADLNVFQDSFLIQGIDYDTDSKDSEETLRSLFNLRLPKKVSLKKIEERLLTVYTSRFFKKLDYRLLPAEDNSYILSIRAQAQSGSFLKASANYDSDYGGSVLLNATLRNKLIKRSKLSVDLRVSENPAILMDYIFYTPSRPSFGTKLHARYNLFNGNFYYNNELINEFDWGHGVVQLDFFTAISSKLSLSLGYGGEIIQQSNNFYDPDSDELRLLQHYGYFAANRDTYNRIQFPTKGSIVSFKAYGYLGGEFRRKNVEDVTSSFKFSYRLQGEAGRAFPINDKFTIRWNNYAGYQRFDEYNALNLFYIGRLLPYENQHVPFRGLRFMEQPADRYVTSALAFQLEPFSNKFIVGSFNYGYYHKPDYEFFTGEMLDIQEQEDFISGAGLELGILTPIGPGSFLTQYNFEESQLSFILHLGYRF